MIYRIALLLFSLGLTGFNSLKAQPTYAFQASSQASLINALSDSLLNPFAGGLNNPQLHTMDVNGDGQQDMVVFDREGYRWLVFDWQNGQWVFQAQWASCFPAVTDWVELIDYNCDGIEDLFCAAIGGVGLYDGSRVNGQLTYTWSLTGNYITTNYNTGGNPVNLYVASNDRPVIKDMDGDGDVDVLTFGLNGTSIEFHRNLSACGINFEVADLCWGDFTESGVTNGLIIDACTGSEIPIDPFQLPEGSQHAGSAMLSVDLDGNGLLDILLGDISFPQAVAGFNVGTASLANIESQDSSWPSNDIPLHLPVFPGFSDIDADRDGLIDIVAAPNMPTGISDTSVWLYRNAGSLSSPDWTLIDSSFLQQTMLDLGRYAVPLLVDLNTDGLMDLLVGSARGLLYYVNTGTAAAPKWVQSPLIGGNHGLLDADWTSPTLADWNGDGLKDVLVGRSDGTLALLINNGNFFLPAFNGVSTNQFAGIDVGQMASPEWHDSDGDGDLDLFVGNQQGHVAHYINNGGTYSLSNANFGGIEADINGLYSGRAIPRIVDFGDGPIMFLGSAEGGIMQLDSLNFTLNAPAVVNHSIGNASTSTSSLLETPFGSSKRTGRHQYLYKASELNASGISAASITHIGFNVITNSAPYLSQGFTITLKHVNEDSLVNFSPGGQTVFNYIQVPSLGWMTVPLQQVFNYDGSSDLMVQVCFSKNLPSTDVHLSAHTTANPSHVYGDVFNNNSMISDGCVMPTLGHDSLRIDMAFTMVPNMPIRHIAAKDGRINAPTLADMDGDGHPEMVFGLSTGGLRFMRGDSASISLVELTGPNQGMAVWPNPGQSSFSLIGNGNPVNVHHINGQTMLTQATVAHKTLTIDCRQWPAGLYVIRMGAFASKWVKP
ncbi:MAG: T9SS type A sorting domain-containing protein [Schleiferiaceae bacterium]|nr:T9SS type A sorting domain-containing protein [Schleiferiaceae bacterium]